MAMIYVRTRPGRRAMYEGKIIPNDQFIPVTDTPAVRRLIDHWQDVEVGDQGTGDTRKKRKTEPEPTT